MLWLPIATAICIASLAANAQKSPDLGAFAPLSSIPKQVDAAAVFENPAETLLLSPVGRSMRSLLAMGGVFTQTERAWQALGNASDTSVDDTIRALLSKRVAVVWDGFERGDPSVQGLTDSIDTRWTLLCEVDPAYLKQIRETMRPVKRDIVHGRAVYAIEQGRYRVALLETPKPGSPAMVLLAPRSGTELLHAVMGSIINRENPAEHQAAITSGREHMLNELNAHHAANADDTLTFALIARTPIFRSLIAQPVVPEQDEEHIIAAIVKLGPGTMRCLFASDLPIANDLPDAPVALLESVRADAIFALASSRSPRLTVNQDAMELGLKLNTNPDDSVPDSGDTTDLLDAPALVIMQPTGPDNTVALSVLLHHPKREPGETARRSDDAVQGMIAGFDQSQAPSFGGRLPAATRSIAIRQRNGIEYTPSTTWPGSEPRIAWQTTGTSSADIFIATMTPGPTDPAAPLRLFHDAVHTLDALGEQPRSGVLLHAMLKPDKAIKMLGDPSLMDLALAKLVRQMDLQVKRGIHASFRGELYLRFTDAHDGTNLGSE